MCSPGSPVGWKESSSLLNLSSALSPGISHPGSHWHEQLVPSVCPGGVLRGYGKLLSCDAYIRKPCHLDQLQHGVVHHLRIPYITPDCVHLHNEWEQKNSDISRLPKPELQRNYVNVIICTSNLKSCFSIYLIPSLRRNLFCSSFQNINIPRNKHRKHLMSSKKLSYYTFLFKFLS